MLRLIQLLIFGHIHQWKIIKEYVHAKYKDGYPDKVVSINLHFILQCEKCGKLKFEREQ